MNCNGVESNPTSSQYKKKSFNNLNYESNYYEEPLKTELSVKEGSKMQLLNNIYKPPIRSKSRHNKNLSSYTTTFTNSTSNSTVMNKLMEDLKESEMKKNYEKDNLNDQRQGEYDYEYGYQTTRENNTINKNSFVTNNPTSQRPLFSIKSDLNPFVKYKTIETEEDNNLRQSKNNLNYSTNFSNRFNQSNQFNHLNRSNTLSKTLSTNLIKNSNNITKAFKPSNIITALPQNHQAYVINLEDLMLLEEKLDEIINNLNINRPLINECFEWWNFYFTCSLCGKFEHYFKEESHKQVIRDYTNLELMTILICYDSSHDKILLEKMIGILKSVLNLLHQNFLVICDYIISKVAVESQSNLWVTKLRNLVESKMTMYKDDEILELKILSTYSYVSEIKSNNSCVYDFLRIVLKNYDQDLEITEILLAYFKNLSKMNVNMLNEFFRTKVLRVLNKNGSVLASSLTTTSKSEFGQISSPYLKNKPKKEYTLVLDLDETLMHFKIDSEDENKGLLRLRPGIFDFLDAVSKFYELVVFTAATKDYADTILDAIDQDNIYFDYRLYRQHTVIVDDDFVKDISKLGRDLSKIIIIDNMPQNFRLQKENGIFIKTFYGEDQDDSALIDLIPILTKIAYVNAKDVRVSLVEYKDEILKKISSNLDKQKKKKNNFKIFK